MRGAAHVTTARTWSGWSYLLVQQDGRWVVYTQGNG